MPVFLSSRWLKNPVAVSAVLSAASILLAGCGGGGGGGGGGGDTSTTSIATTTTTASTRTTTTTSHSVPAGFFECQSDLQFDNLADMDKKGIAVDDNTFGGCIQDMPLVWPNTNQKVQSLRFFRSWTSEWGDDAARLKAWYHIVDYVKQNDVKVLVGQDVTCDNASDDKEWLLNLEFLKLLGKDHVMGVAIGNEMDIYYTKPGVSQECIKRLWDSEYWNTYQRRVADLDKNGFGDAKVTVVWAGSIMAAEPFINIPQAPVLDFVTTAFKKYGRRWVWSPTIYPIWDSSILPTPEQGPSKCQAMIDLATDMTKYNAALVVSYRQRISNVTGNPDDVLWVAETGWSSPAPDGLAPACADYTSISTFEKFYRSFLGWNLTSVQQNQQTAKGPDHIFYFTLRDSNNFGAKEFFGLIDQCGDSECKLTNSALATTTTTATTTGTAVASASSEIIEAGATPSRTPTFDLQV